MSRIKARLRLVTTYHETGSIRETARRWHTSRQIVGARILVCARGSKNIGWLVPIVLGTPASNRAFTG